MPIQRVQVGLRVVDDDQPAIPPHGARESDLPISHCIDRCAGWSVNILGRVVLRPSRGSSVCSEHYCICYEIGPVTIEGEPERETLVLGILLICG